MTTPTPLPERLLASRVVTDRGCWEKSSNNRDYYSRFSYKGRVVGAHRVAYEVFRGPIPEGMCVCHRCNNKRCMNPNHLYLATNKQNIQDACRDGLAKGPPAEKREQSHCIHGHPLSGENLQITRRGRRHCKECQRRHSRDWKARRRERAAAPKPEGSR